MKRKSKELSVDNIGQQINPLTVEEEKIISNYILANKVKGILKKSSRRARTNRKEKQQG